MILISGIINVIVGGRVEAAEDELSALRRFALYLNNKLTFFVVVVVFRFLFEPCHK